MKKINKILTIQGDGYVNLLDYSDYFTMYMYIKSSVYLKYIQFLFVNYTSINGKKFG